MGIAKTKRMTEATLTCQTKGPGTYPYMAPYKVGEDQLWIFILLVASLLSFLEGRKYGSN